MTKLEEQAQILKSNSWRMFNEISLRYDFLNHFLSLGLDIRWRRQLVRYLPEQSKLQLLDLATGTGDVAIALLRNSTRLESAVGLDMAGKMLAVGREKIARLKLTQRIQLKYGNANKIPFANQTFSVISMAFGIRNVEDPTRVIKEMHRVLTKNGRTLILEFSLPHNAVLRFFHLFYLRHIVPLIGAVFSGHYRAYKYLNQTIETFPYGDNFCRLLQNAGFKNVKANTLLFGVATIYQGDKI